MKVKYSDETPIVCGKNKSELDVDEECAGCF
jgi:hypothetical protein